MCVCVCVGGRACAHACLCIYDCETVVAFVLIYIFRELYDGIFKIEPYTDLRRNVKGCFTTCYLKMVIDVQNAIVKGKMCIRNANKDPIDTEYE